MPFILNIDTAVQTASVCLANGDEVIDISINPSEKESASWLHGAIRDLLNKNNLQLQQVEAVAVSSGPGSYTGLRVGMAAAKGLCYALSIPLISVPTLLMMAGSVPPSPVQLICPMIDARRSEVFTALYDASYTEVMPATALILEEDAFNDWLQKNTIAFFGNGSIKAAGFIHHSNATFINATSTAKHMPRFSAQMLEQDQFSDLAYAEPFYGKGFYSPPSKKKSVKF